MTNQDVSTNRVRQGLAHGNPSARLQAAMAAGANPDPWLVDTLVDRCAVEPDFYVREMLTWALTRLPPSAVLPRLLTELRSAHAPARSQTLHTLSKIGDRAAWPAITRDLLSDPDDEVAKAAWRAAVALAPADAAPELAADLVTQLGRGGRDTQLSLGRALVTLGEAATPALRAAAESQEPGVRAHALAIQKLAVDPEAGFEYAVEQAKRIVALGPEPSSGGRENGGHADR
jgi:HEAT repeat protein